MRCILPALLILSVSLLAGCTYGTDFVVVNDTGQAAEVSYRPKVMPPNSPLYFTGVPAKLAASQLRHSGQQWRELAPGEFRLDEGSRTVIVPLAPGEALLVTRVGDYDYYDEDSRRAELFPIEEVAVAGAGGEMKVTGEQARKAFIKESAGLYVIAYK
jgi:hypothetical protein